jgi:Flp pilus assembly protein TadG
MRLRALGGRLWSRIRRLAASGDAGSSTAELALAIPVLMGILLFLVLCGPLVSAQMDLDAAAGAAARSGSIARSETTARAEAERITRQILAARGVTCRNATVSVTANGLRPGGAVTVTVSCTVPLSDLLLLGVPGSRTVSASATSPVDQWRGRALGFETSEAASAAKRSGGRA